MAMQDDDMSDIATTVLQYAPFMNFTDKDGDEEMRSPRTPTWAPSVAVTPFDFEKYFPRTPLPAHMKKAAAIPPPPESPLPWIWQCHLCRNRYPLGVTRRCLYDGHYYCSGETNVKNLKKKRKGHACSSEFDYEGWDEYGDWRREALQAVDNKRTLKRCEKCDFPSMCRTPKEQYPVQKPEKTRTSIALVEPTSKKQDKKPTTKLEFLLPSAEELTAMHEWDPEDEKRQAGSSSAKADKSIDFDAILHKEVSPTGNDGQKLKQRQSKVTDLWKGSMSNMKKDKSNGRGLTLNLEQEKPKKAVDFVMPSLDL
jgi:hypothetical protein